MMQCCAKDAEIWCDGEKLDGKVLECQLRRGIVCTGDDGEYVTIKPATDDFYLYTSLDLDRELVEVCYQGVPKYKVAVVRCRLMIEGTLIK